MKGIDPHADAFCRLVAEILIDQTKKETGVLTETRAAHPPKQKSKMTRVRRARQ